MPSHEWRLLPPPPCVSDPIRAHFAPLSVHPLSPRICPHPVFCRLAWHGRIQNKTLVKVGKLLKKNNVAADVVSMGETEVNQVRQHASWEPPRPVSIRIRFRCLRLLGWMEGRGGSQGLHESRVCAYSVLVASAITSLE